MADTCLSKWLRSLLQLAIPGNYMRRINYDSTTVNISVFIEQTNISFENDIFHWKPWDWECTLSWEKLKNRETQGRIVSLDQQLGVEEQFFIADLPGIMFITWTSDCGPVTPVKCTKSAHRGIGNDLWQLPFWYRALSCGADWFTKGVYIWVTHLRIAVPTITCSLRYA